MTHDDFKPFLALFMVAGMCAVFGYAMARAMSGYMGALRKIIVRTEEQKKNDPLVDRCLGYLRMLSGRLSVLFITLGLFVMAAESVHSWVHADDSDPRVDAVLCLRAGTCEVS